MIGFGEDNIEFGSLPPYVLSCEEIIVDEKDEYYEPNALLIKIETESGMILSINFKSYIMHMTRNESYTAWDDYEVRKGKYLVLFEKSKYMDFYDQVIIHTDDYSWPGKGKHYGVYTCNHIIDVLTVDDPVLTVERKIGIRNSFEF